MTQVPWKEGSDILYVALFVEVGLLKMFSLVEMAIFHKTASYIKTCFAERGGFEPPNRFRRLHAFQACLFSHSSTFPSTIYANLIKPLAVYLRFFVFLPSEDRSCFHPQSYHFNS